MPERTRDDTGFTLTELMVVLLLMGFILAAVFLGIQVIRGSADASQRDAWVASNTVTPLLYIEQRIGQAVTISTSPNSNGTTMQFTSDPNLDGSSEQHNIAVAGGTLTDTVYPLVNGVPTVGAARVSTLLAASTGADYPAIANTTAMPLFTYLAADSTTTVDPSNAKSILVKVWISYKGQTYSDQKQVFLHNRQ